MAAKKTWTGRQTWSAGPAVTPPAVACPVCKALPYVRCWEMRSWVRDDTHPQGGFYTRRKTVAHPERTAVARGTVEEDPRRELRRRISKLAQRKLAGGERVRVRQWANEVARTPQELTEKITALEAMSDLAW